MRYSFELEKSFDSLFAPITVASNIANVLCFISSIMLLLISTLSVSSFTFLSAELDKYYWVLKISRKNFIEDMSGSYLMRHFYNIKNILTKSVHEKQQLIKDESTLVKLTCSYNRLI